METLARDVTESEASRLDEFRRLALFWMFCDEDRDDEKEEVPDVHRNSPTPLSPLFAVGSLRS